MLPKIHRSVISFAILAILMTTSQILTVLPAQAQRSTMGMNLQMLNDSSCDRLFADAFKTWRPGSGGQLQNGAPSDANGWPTVDFTALMWDGGFLPNTSGHYALKFNGKATITNVTVANQVYDSASNTTTADVTCGNGTTWLIFTNTQRTNGSATNTGLTNVQMMRPTTYGGSTSYSFNTLFTTPIVNFCQKFQCLRFMDYLATNGNPTVNWSDRTRPTYANLQATNNGGPLEYAIALCNQTGCDAWINVPAMATDDYITKMAQMFKYGSDGTNPYTSTQANPVYAPLNSNLHVYVEYANELWNFAFGFSQSQYNHDQAQTDSNLNWDGETNEWTLAWRRPAYRCFRQSQIFRAVFGDAAFTSQVRPVDEWQIGDGQGTGSAQTGLLSHYASLNGHPVNYYVYGGGGSYYYSPSDKTSVNQIFATMPQSWETAGFQTDQNLCNSVGILRTAYEGGPSLDSTGNSSQDANQATAMLDARMEGVITTNHTHFLSLGGTLLCYFDSTGLDWAHDQWSFTDDPGNLSTPKMKGIIDIFNTGGGGNTAPSTPTGLSASAGNSQITLAWTGSTGTPTPTYNVYRGTAAGGESTTAITTGLGTTSFTNTGLTNGATYFYTVKAVNSVGTSAASNEASATPQGATSGPVAINAGGTASGSFIADTDFSAGSTSSTASAITTTGVTNPAPQAVYQTERYGNFTYTIPGLTAGGSYTVRLHFAEIYFTASGQRVFNVAINGTTVLTNFDIFAKVGANTADVEQFTTTANASGQVAIVFTTVTNNAKISGIEVISGAPSVPAAPTGLGATAGNTQVALSWTASSGATSYNVYRGTAAGGESGTAIVTGVSTTSYTNTGLTNGTTYYYKVAAVNSAGTSGMSNEANAKPVAPTGGPVQINTGGPAVSPYIADVDFSGGTAATNYTGVIDTTGLTTPAPQAVYQSERYGASTYTIPGLTSGSSYTVRLHFCENFFTTSGQRVFNVAINGTSVLSNFDIEATAGAAHKGVIKSFTATANGSGQVVVAFTNVTNNGLINGIEVTAGGGSTGSLTGSLAVPSGNPINLTTEGTADWAAWGAEGAITNFDHKSTGGTQISNYTKVGSGSILTNNTLDHQVSWTSGTPTATGTSVNNNITSNTVAGGYTFTAPASTTSHTLRVYVGEWGTVSGKLVAHLSDGSAADFVDTSFVSTANPASDVIKCYTITYKAASASQTLTVTWTAASGTGNLDLSAATLQ